MDNLKKIVRINAENLSQENYFESLLEEACQQKMLNEGDFKRIQTELLALVSWKTRCYTSGDSSSVPIELARHIMRSNLYTIGIRLKNCSDPDTAAEALKLFSIEELYREGRSRIGILLKTAMHLHRMAVEGLAPIDNEYYCATVRDGVKGFFKLYDADYGAQEIHITVDYPLCHPVEDLTGVEYIIEYLNRIIQENRFMGLFPSEAVRRMLYGYHKNYGRLVLNLYEQVLISATGCMLAGNDPRGLSVTRGQTKELEAIWIMKSKEEVEALVTDAGVRLVEEMSVRNENLRSYLRASLPCAAVNIYCGIERLTLEKVLVEAQIPELAASIRFASGKRMEDEKYRKVLDEVMQCRSKKEKAAVIKKRLHSLDDLEDILMDAELDEEEAAAVFKILGPAELAELAKRYACLEEECASSDMESDELEQNICVWLNQYIKRLPREKREWIIHACGLLKEE